MYIQVKLLNGFQEPLLYAIPPEWHNKNLVGRLVRVPIRQRFEPALIIAHHENKPQDCNFTIKQVSHFEPFPADKHYARFIQQLAQYYCTNPISFIRRIRHFLEQQANDSDVPALPVDEKNNIIPSLTDEQQVVYDFVAPRIEKPSYTPVLLHGVTGSGKTEVYKQLILKTLSLNKSVIVLLPEVTLALQFEALFKRQLPSVQTVGFHSATSAQQKKQTWQLLIEEKPLLLLGVHLPVLLPISNLGLIIIDEEHDAGYQEKKHPKINSKEVALLKANYYNIPIVLGSATPSISSLHTYKTKNWYFFQLKKRFSGAFPIIQKVLLSDKKQRKNFWISTTLEAAIKDRLAKKEQTIIFINRRGYSFFVQCKACSYIFGCPSCSVSLTLHEPDTLNCHYCSRTMHLPSHCTSCKQGSDQFLKKGLGTQQVVSILEKMFPQARIARADLDSTSKKKSWEKTVADMQAGTIDILIGTQTITKGYHFPLVTLVGILWADLNLNFPIYNASEIALQQLIQVAGRAGRQSQESLVIVQSMADHTIFAYLNEIDYLSFYEKEIESRSLVKYPPCIRLAELELRNASDESVQCDADHILELAQNYCTQKEYSVLILGPAKPPVHKIKNMNFRKLYFKSNDLKEILALMRYLMQQKLDSTLFFTPNPLQ